MTTIGSVWLWAGFGIFVLLALCADFAVMRHQGAHRVGMREALWWSVAWIVLALIFNGLLWWDLDVEYGRALANQRALEFLAGYLIEKALAVDNLFVFLTIFSFFAVPIEFQKRVLMIGIIGAIVLRAILIFLGAILIQQFHWILYVFGAFLLLTGVQMWRAADEEIDLADNRVLKLMRRFIPFAPHYDGEKFITRHGGMRMATPLLLVVLFIGVIDVVFAVDSIPAIFAITTDPFIVLTSNVFAVLGLRAMYFLLAGMADRFHLLSYGLALILAFVGAKMLLADVFKIPVVISLAVVVGILILTAVASVVHENLRKRDAGSDES